MVLFGAVLMMTSYELGLDYRFREKDILSQYRFIVSMDNKYNIPRKKVQGFELSELTRQTQSFVKSYREN